MATFKSKMKHLPDDWADQIWAAAKARNDGAGAKWLLALAALAVTGARPASLERGITFAARMDPKRGPIIEATILGAKLLENADGTPRRGQREVKVAWQLGRNVETPTHRPKEFEAIAGALAHAPGRTLTISYDAEAISTRLRELSRELWPRKQHHVSGVCYRELVSETNKAAGVAPAEIAAAMSHLSTESQGRYAGPPRRRKGAVKPVRRTFSSVVASTPVRADRSPMARFKRSKAIARVKAGKS